MPKLEQQVLDAVHDHDPDRLREVLSLEPKLAARGRHYLLPAVNRGLHRCIEVLADAGADLHEVVAGRSYLHRVIDPDEGYAPKARDRVRAAECLLARECDIEARDRKGRTPLLLLAEQAHNPGGPWVQLLELLLAHGANTAATTKGGKTALLECLTKTGVQTRVLELLVEHTKDLQGEHRLRGVKVPKGQKGSSLPYLASEDSDDGYRLLRRAGAAPMAAELALIRRRKRSRHGSELRRPDIAAMSAAHPRSLDLRLLAAVKRLVVAKDIEVQWFSAGETAGEAPFALVIADSIEDEITEAMEQLQARFADQDANSWDGESILVEASYRLKWGYLHGDEGVVEAGGELVLGALEQLDYRRLAFGGDSSGSLRCFDEHPLSGDGFAACLRPHDGHLESNVVVRSGWGEPVEDLHMSYGEYLEHQVALLGLYGWTSLFSGRLPARGPSKGELSLGLEKLAAAHPHGDYGPYRERLEAL